MESRMARLIIETNVRTGIPVIITGEPGTGKTFWVQDHGEVVSVGSWPSFAPENSSPDSRWAIVQVMASVRDPEDIAGWPIRDPEHGLVMEPAAWGKLANKMADQGYFVVVFFDEARTITAPKQAAVLKVVHERFCGDIQLNREIRFIMAANSVEQSAGGVPLEAPMSNRLAHVPWVPDPRDWQKSMAFNKFRTQSPIPQKMMERLGEERGLIAAFIQKRPSLLQSVPPDEEHRDGPWPSCRTWDYAAHLLTMADGQDENLRHHLIASVVGLDAASEFVVWQKELDLPDPEEVLQSISTQKPIKVAYKERPDKTFAILSGVTWAVTSKWTPDRYERAFKVLNKCSTDGLTDIAGAFVYDLYQTRLKQKVAPDVTKHLRPFVDLLKKSGVPWAK